MGKFAVDVVQARLRVERVFKCADAEFIVVACVNNDDVRVADECVPVLGFDIGADHAARVDAFDAHGDDFFFEFDLAAVERHGIVMRKFAVDVVQARLRVEPCAQCVDGVLCACDGAVDAFACQQQCAANLLCVHDVEQRLAQGFILGQFDKLVHGADDDLRHNTS